MPDGKAGHGTGNGVGFDEGWYYIGIAHVGADAPDCGNFRHRCLGPRRLTA
jgi:hypothetical protein